MKNVCLFPWFYSSNSLVAEINCYEIPHLYTLVQWIFPVVIVHLVPPRRATFIYNSQRLGLIKTRNLLNQVTSSINEVFHSFELKNSQHLTCNKSYLENIFPFNIFSFLFKVQPTRKQLLATLDFQKVNFIWEAHIFFPIFSQHGKFLWKKKKCNPFWDSLWILFFILYDFILVK